MEEFIVISVDGTCRKVVVLLEVLYPHVFVVREPRVELVVLGIVSVPLVWVRLMLAVLVFIDRV